MTQQEVNHCEGVSDILKSELSMMLHQRQRGNRHYVVMVYIKGSADAGAPGEPRPVSHGQVPAQEPFSEAAKTLNLPANVYKQRIEYVPLIIHILTDKCFSAPPPSEP